MLALYLHIPFCLRKCLYCDFFSIAVSPPDLDEYQQLLARQIDWAAGHGWHGPVSSIYFGGGTPSLLPPAAVTRLLKAIDAQFGLAGEVEISLEANPGTVNQKSLAGFRAAGINRLSLGLQSFNDRHLSLLGRQHNSDQGLEAVRMARAAGFDNLSVDFLFGLPGQTRPELERDLATLVRLDVEHLSCYGLTAESGTPLAKSVTSGEVQLPDEDFYADAFMLIHEQLVAASYEHYEIANYARVGETCRHNLGYWRRQPCLGIGAGAHSFISEGWGSRWMVPADLDLYRQTLHHNQEPMQCLESFDRGSALSETVYLAMRTRRGVDDAELMHRFGMTFQQAYPEAVAANRQWLVQVNNHWAFKPEGWLLFDRLILPFL
jgi:oxygen-independent coproporphyrinogen-3 oxidase